MHKYKIFILGIIKSIIFGSSFLITAKAIEKLNVFDLLSLRFLTAAVVFEILRITVLKFKLTKKELLKLLPVAIFMPLGYYIFEAIGIKGASSMAAGIIISFVPAVTLVFEFLKLKKAPGIKKTFYILLAVGGVILITLFSKNSGTDTLLGILFLVLAASSEGLYAVVSKERAESVNSVKLTYFMMWAGALIFNLINIIRKINLGETASYFSPLFDLPTLLIILYMGIVPLIIAFFIYNYMLSKDESSSVSIYTSLETVVAIFLGTCFNNEPLFWYHIVGTIMIFIGVWSVNKNEAHSKDL